MYSDPTVESQVPSAEIATPRSTGAELMTDPTCLEHTYMALREHGLATPDELRQLAEVGQDPLEGDRQLDPLELLVNLRISDAAQRPPEIERMGRAMSQMLGDPLVLVPFAHRMPTPTAFYDTFPVIYGMCQDSLIAVIFAEESEVVGIASINPVPLNLMVDQISHTMSEVTGTRPIVTRMLVTHEAWESLCKKQLDL